MSGRNLRGVTIAPNGTTHFVASTLLFGQTFLREAAGEQVLVLANLTGRGLGMRLTDGDLMGPWREVWGPVGPGDQEVAVTKADPLGLTAWGVRVLVRAIG